MIAEIAIVNSGCGGFNDCIGNSYSQFGLRGRAPRGVTGELSPASVYVSLLPVVEACVVVAVPGRVGEVQKSFAFNRDSRVFAVFEAHLRPSPLFLLFSSRHSL